MNSLIVEKSPLLGGTETGRAWCLKALHPADPLVECKGIPDQSCVPSVHMNYQTTVVIPPPAAIGPDETWSADITFNPHPIQFASFSKWVEPSGLPQFGGVLNAQLSGVTHADKYLYFRTLAQAWRLTYAGLTMVQDAPALADQGRVLVAQHVAKPLVSGMGFAGSEDYGSGMLPANRSLLSLFQEEDNMTWDAGMGMPNFYLGKSKDGIYVPLKLTRSCQEWQSESTQTRWASGNGSEPSVGYRLAGSYTIPVVVSDQTLAWPFYGLQQATVIAGAVPPLRGHVTSAMCNDVIGAIRLRNVSAKTNMVLTIRMGFQLRVLPMSPLASQQVLSPPYDKRSLQAYFSVMRELKDAYPADYNDAAKILGVITPVLRTLAPMLSAIPVVGPVLSSVAGLGITGLEYLSKKAQKKAQQALPAPPKMPQPK